MKALLKLRQHFDWPLFLGIFVLCAVGIVNLYSATSSMNQGLLRQQLIRLGIGLIVFLATAAVDYRVLNRLAYPLYLIGLVSLMVVLLFGHSANQSQRWLHFGAFAAQPSELMKIFMIITLAKYLHDDPVSGGRSLKHLMIPFVLVGLPMALIIKQPDLGTAMLIFLLFLSVMFLTKLKLRSLFTLLLVTILTFPLTWNYLLKDYQKQRIYTFLDPGSDPSGAGWQVRQSLIAIGSGGLTGKGYMHGTQNRLRFLPERWTDFPFSVWAEEWGFLGSVFLLGVYLFTILWAVKLATQARDRFGAVLCVGVAALFFWQMVISIGMVTGIAPVVGVTLPLISYGGSSVITIMCAIGLLMNVSIRKSSF